MSSSLADDTLVGGAADTPCFALLDGLVQDTETEELSRFNIPLTKLPAVLGRSHETEDPHFFGLGSRKALSRKQCVIYYRDAQGGRVDWDKTELVYKNSKNKGEDKLLTPTDELPENGFFVVECLGRNRILVDKQRVEQGESVVLESGAAIRISSHMLYFLLPTDAPPKKHLVSPPSSVEKKSTNKKRKSEGSAVRTEITSSSPPPSSSKKTKGVGLVAYTQELETLPTEELLTLMSAAVASNQWERKHQMIGTVVVLRAVKDAAKAPTIQEYAKDNGVARSRIIEWIEKSSKYSQWVQQMLSKVEARSYQAAITKSLLKAGYARNGTSGRYVKWHLPPGGGDDEKETGQEEEGQSNESSQDDDDDEAEDKNDDDDDDEEDNSNGSDGDKQEGDEAGNDEEEEQNEAEEEQEQDEGEEQEEVQEESSGEEEDGTLDQTLEANISLESEEKGNADQAEADNAMDTNDDQLIST